MFKLADRDAGTAAYTLRNEHEGNATPLEHLHRSGECRCIRETRRGTGRQSLCRALGVLRRRAKLGGILFRWIPLRASSEQSLPVRWGRAFDLGRAAAGFAEGFEA